MKDSEIGPSVWLIDFDKVIRRLNRERKYFQKIILEQLNIWCKKKPNLYFIAHLKVRDV
jgi:hypothetical protein